jgi:hypothetical protein
VAAFPQRGSGCGVEGTAVEEPAPPPLAPGRDESATCPCHGAHHSILFGGSSWVVEGLSCFSSCRVIRGRGDSDGALFRARTCDERAFSRRPCPDF